LSLPTAFTAAWFIGPRVGRFDKGSTPAPLPDPVSACLGMLIVWWGWIGFNAGSSYGVTGGKWEQAARAGAGTTLASMAAGTASIIFSAIKNKGKVDTFEVICGILSGLGRSATIQLIV
jgi:ammonium transporter, Amt family